MDAVISLPTAAAHPAATPPSHRIGRQHNLPHEPLPRHLLHRLPRLLRHLLRPLSRLRLPPHNQRRSLHLRGPLQCRLRRPLHPRARRHPRRAQRPRRPLLAPRHPAPRRRLRARAHQPPPPPPWLFPGSSVFPGSWNRGFPSSTSPSFRAIDRESPHRADIIRKLSEAQLSSKGPFWIPTTTPNQIFSPGRTPTLHPRPSPRMTLRPPRRHPSQAMKGARQTRSSRMEQSSLKKGSSRR